MCSTGYVGAEHFDALLPWKWYFTRWRCPLWEVARHCQALQARFWQKMAPWITGPLPPRQTQERKTTLLRTFSQFAAERHLLSIQNTVAAAPRVNKRSSAFDNSLCKFTIWKPVVVCVCASRGQGTGARRSTVETPFPETERLSKPL